MSCAFVEAANKLIEPFIDPSCKKLLGLPLGFDAPLVKEQNPIRNIAEIGRAHV